MKKFLIIVASIILALIVGSLIYLNMDQYSATDVTILEFEEEFIQKDGYFEHEIDSNIGFIMYQGAKVDPRSYSYLKDIDASVYISDFAYGISFFNPNLTKEIISENPQVDTWYFAGHSLGGSVVYDQALKSDQAKGVFMMGSYPIKKVEENVDFSSTGFFATKDGLIQDYEDMKLLYPENSQFVMIEGGNHGQYGEYGVQKGDMQADITSAEQHKIIVDTINSSISKG
jgi:hypothetical protein